MLAAMVKFAVLNCVPRERFVASLITRRVALTPSCRPPCDAVPPGNCVAQRRLIRKAALEATM